MGHSQGPFAGLQFHSMYLGGFEVHLSLIHSQFEGVGLGSPEEDNVLILECFQGFGVPPFIHRHILCADTEPKVVGKTTFLALQETKRIRVSERHKREMPKAESKWMGDAQSFFPT